MTNEEALYLNYEELELNHIELKKKINKFILWLKGHAYRPNNLYTDIMEKLKELGLLEKQFIINKTEEQVEE